jgi:polysaccharide export outer membrane protein
MRPSLEPLLLAAILAVAPGCSSVGNYVWVDSIPETAAPSETEYVVAVGDVLSVRVFGQENLSGRARVRHDGKISLALLNDVEAAGQTPAALARRLQARLKDFVKDPVVTVSLEEPGSIQVSVLGDVARPGVVRVEPGSGVLHALATAGGLTQFAGRDRIFVLRKGSPGSTPPLLRIRFSYEALSRAEGRSATFRLRDGDVLVVE